MSVSLLHLLTCVVLDPVRKYHPGTKKKVCGLGDVWYIELTAAMNNELFVVEERERGVVAVYGAKTHLVTRSNPALVRSACFLHSLLLHSTG
jgi:hypothetical protein